MNQNQGMSSGMCRCPHHRATGMFIFLIALAFLLKALGVLGSDFVDIAWPVLLGLAALKKMFKGMCRCCAQSCSRDCCK